jgi:probable biosynthetic protein (TIGR04098 family)
VPQNGDVPCRAGDDVAGDWLARASLLGSTQPFSYNHYNLRWTRPLDSIVPELQTAPMNPTSSIGFELGMPLLGRHNLSESSLFKLLGHHRWEQIQEKGRVLTSDIRDDAGSRLYATFFFLELHLSPNRPLSHYGENCRLTFHSDLFHYQKVYLDGRYTMAGDAEQWLRASNVFIYQERGPSKLSLSTPETMDFSGIPELAAAPDSLDLCRESRLRGSFFGRKTDDLDLYEGDHQFVYQIDADRDLNGAGLVYFANFLSVLDSAERHVLGNLPDAVPADILDARSPYLRRIGYFGNAQSTDALCVGLRSRARVVEEAGGGTVLDLAFDARVRRSSDDKEVVISSCRKVAAVGPRTDGAVWLQRFLASRPQAKG